MLYVISQNVLTAPFMLCMAISPILCNKCIGQVPTDYFRPGSNGLFYKNISEPDEIVLAGINLKSEDLRPLTHCEPILKFLRIENAPKITDDTLLQDVLAHQQALEVVSFENTGISDKTVLRIAELKRLKILHISNNDYITWKSIYYLSLNKHLLESMEILALRGNNIGRKGSHFDYKSDEYEALRELYDKNGGLAIVGKFKNLCQLYLHDNGNTILSEMTAESTMSSIAGLSKLTTLAISGDGITDAIMNRHIAKLVNLQQLDLSGTDITDECISVLMNLACLKTLVIKCTNITPEGLNHLKLHQSLESITVDYSPVNSQFYDKFNFEMSKQKKTTPKLSVINTVDVPLYFPNRF